MFPNCERPNEWVNHAEFRFGACAASANRLILANMALHQVSPGLRLPSPGHTNVYRRRLTFARSMMSLPRPSRTALIMNRLKPLI
jgi:hypothetical protein